MKRLLALLLAAGMCLALVACGDTGDTANSDTTNNGNEAQTQINEAQEQTGSEAEDAAKVLENYTDLDVKTFYDDCGNVARLNTTYVGNAYKFTVETFYIENDYILADKLYNPDSNSYFSPYIFIKIYLPQEVLAEIELGEDITVIGAIDYIDEYEAGEIYGFGSEKRPRINVTPAKLVVE